LSQTDNFFGTLLVVDNVFRLLDLGILEIPLSVDKIRGPKDKPASWVFDSLRFNLNFFQNLLNEARVISPISANNPNDSTDCDNFIFHHL
jgi:hypothetical protein